MEGEKVQQIKNCKLEFDLYNTFYTKNPYHIFQYCSDGRSIAHCDTSL